MGIVKLDGVLELPPGEYRLTLSVAMDGPLPPVTRTDIAHVFSNLVSPAAFLFDSTDLTITIPGPDTGGAFITKFTFTETPTATTVIGSNPGPDGTRLIMVMIPDPLADLTQLTPKVECAPGAHISSPAPSYDLADPENPIHWVKGDYSRPTSWTAVGRNGMTQQYTVVVSKVASSECLIMDIAFEEVGLVQPPRIVHPANSGTGTITVVVPGGTLSAYPNYRLTPVISWVGATLRLSPSTTLTTPLDLRPDKTFRVTSASSAWKDYTLTIQETPLPLSTDAGIFDFVITNVPKAKVVIGTKPRSDGKIPIVVQVPYKTSPLTTDGSNRTDLEKLIPRITLSNPLSSISPSPNGTSDFIPFSNQNDFQEAIYTVTPQAGTAYTQDYVVVVARDVQYYYVKASGSDTDPDLYNGDSESKPFKTLAYAVSKAVQNEVDHIFIIGTLNDTSEGGAYEDTEDIEVDSAASESSNTFHLSGASATSGGASVFNLNGSGRLGPGGTGASYPIYITGVGSNAILQGTGSKRVISITGGANIIFDNITIQGGGNASYNGNGGGMYVGGNSTVIWKSGSITGNTAPSGGGVYLGSDAADESEFDFMTGTISGNTTTGITATHFTTGNSPTIQGGGGVYVYGNSLLWLAEGQITNNSTKGSGGGVLVNGSTIPDDASPATTPHNFIMSAGSVDNNSSSGNTWPHGGGGVFVAKGVFTMLNGQIVNNSSVRQGGGVFVWSQALFWMDGNSLVTGNSGVGSAKAICSRGITTIRGNAQADKVYVWNYAEGDWNNGDGDEFTVMEGARIGGLVLAFADDPVDNRNYINIVPSDRTAYGVGNFFSSGTDPITTIDLESRLNSNGSFSSTTTVDADWLNKYLIKNDGNEIPIGQAAALLKRFPLGSFTSGKPSLSLSKYKLDTAGKLVSK
jgi:hypothetical protein